MVDDEQLRQALNHAAQQFRYLRNAILFLGVVGLIFVVYMG